MDKLRKDATAVAWVAGVFLVVAIVGFTPRYFGPLLDGSYRSPSAWMHIHAISTMFWLGVFLVQPLLILGRKFARHRLFGRVALFVAFVTAATGFALQFDLLPVAPGDAGNLGAFTARFVSALAIFIPAVVLAIVYRRRTGWHLRLMYVATMSLMPSPIGRIIVTYVGVPLDVAGPMIGATNLLMAAALPIYDRLAHGKVERISWIALGAVIAAQAITGFLIGNPWWGGLLTGQ